MTLSSVIRISASSPGRSRALATLGGRPLNFIAEVGMQVWPPTDVELPRQVEEGLELTERLEKS
jgi:hypothetical protein